MALKEFSKQIFKSGLESVLPRSLILNNLKIDKGQLFVAGKNYNLDNNVFVIGFGKAVLGMAQALESLLENHLQKGIVSVPVGIHESLSNSPFKDARKMLLSEGSKILAKEGARNNLPDYAAMQTAVDIENFLKNLQADDILISLISGGGSALLPAPVKEISLSDKLETIKRLSKNGATIQELNTVRKHLSRLKGGKLASMTKCKSVISLILSDIVGDPIDLIASGPTCKDTSQSSDCIEIFKRYSMLDNIPEKVKEYLSRKQSEPAHVILDLPNVQNVIIGNNKVAIAKCKEMAESKGYPVMVMSDSLTGDVQRVASTFSSMLLLFMHDRMPQSKLCFDQQLIKEAYHMFKTKGKICLLSAGETTVHVKGTGKGGRNQELVLWTGYTFEKLVKSLKLPAEKSGVSYCFLSAGTDGQDGPTPAAGATFTKSLFVPEKIQALQIEKYLRNNGSYDFFSTFDDGSDLFVTGLTGTNVMDIQILLVEKA
eukprot:gene4783-21092_t